MISFIWNIILFVNESRLEVSKAQTQKAQGGFYLVCSQHLLHNEQWLRPHNYVSVPNAIKSYNKMINFIYFSIISQT